MLLSLLGMYKGATGNFFFSAHPSFIHTVKETFADFKLYAKHGIFTENKAMNNTGPWLQNVTVILRNQ